MPPFLLIPKEEGVNYLDQLYLIALCSVIYKTILKVLANIIKYSFPLLHRQTMRREGKYQTTLFYVMN